MCNRVEPTACLGVFGNMISLTDSAPRLCSLHDLLVHFCNYFLCVIVQSLQLNVGLPFSFGTSKWVGIPFGFPLTPELGAVRWFFQAVDRATASGAVERLAAAPPALLEMGWGFIKLPLGRP